MLWFINHPDSWGAGGRLTIRMNTYLEFFVIFTVVILPQIAYSFFIKEIRDVLGRLTNSWKITSSMINRVGTILLALYVAALQPAGLISIGLNFNPLEIPRVLLVGGLTTVYLCLVFVISRFRSQKVRAEREALQRETFVSLGYTTFKTLSDRFFSLFNLWLSVIAEELIARGYLVLLLSARTGSFIPWILLSITFSVLVHLYQGFQWKIVLAHILFAAIFITVTLLTKNIVTALIPHLVYDSIWMIQRWMKTPAEYINPAEPLL